MNRINHDGALFVLTVRKWGGARKLEPQDLGLSPHEIPEFMQLGRKLLIPREVSLRFARIEACARNLLERYSFSYRIGSARFVPTRAMRLVEERLESYKWQFENARDDFLARYEDIRDEMLRKYEAYRDRLEPFYPPRLVISQKYGFEWHVFEIAPAQAMRNLMSDEEFREYKAKLDREIDAFIEDVIKELRSQVKETCLNLREKLQKNEIVNGQTIRSVYLTIERFKALNFVNDVEIESQLARLKEMLDRHREEGNLTNEQVRNQISDLARDIAREASCISDFAIDELKGRYKRKLEIDE